MQTIKVDSCIRNWCKNVVIFIKKNRRTALFEVCAENTTVPKTQPQ